MEKLVRGGVVRSAGILGLLDPLDAYIDFCYNNFFNNLFVFYVLFCMCILVYDLKKRKREEGRKATSPPETLVGREAAYP